MCSGSETLVAGGGPLWGWGPSTVSTGLSIEMTPLWFPECKATMFIIMCRCTIYTQPRKQASSDFEGLHDCVHTLVWPLPHRPVQLGCQECRSPTDIALGVTKPHKPSHHFKLHAPSDGSTETLTKQTNHVQHYAEISWLGFFTLWFQGSSLGHSSPNYSKQISAPKDNGRCLAYKQKQSRLKQCFWFF